MRHNANITLAKYCIGASELTRFTRLAGPSRALVLAVCASLSSLSFASPTNAPCHNPATCRTLHAAQVIFGIINYAQWPQTPNPLNLCVVGATEYADYLWKKKPSSPRQTVQTQRLLIDNPQVTTACNLIYLGSTDYKQRQQLFQKLTDLPILTITESADGCSEGSQFCLKVIGQEVGFQVNLDAIARSGVRIHPNVLQLGKRPGAQL